MRQIFLCVCLTTLLLFGPAPMLKVASAGSDEAGLSQWDVTSYKVDLLQHRGGSGDIQSDQNGWVHLGGNHLEGGDIIYKIFTGDLQREDILELWIDGYSTSNDLNIGPTVFIGIGNNRFEQITRKGGEAWRPVVFRFADDMVYGDVTDPSNRHSNWRLRHPSTKYEVKRIDKSPRDLIRDQHLPVRISMTGSEDYIIKRVEVVVYRTRPKFAEYAPQKPQYTFGNFDPKTSQAKIMTERPSQESSYSTSAPASLPSVPAKPPASVTPAVPAAPKKIIVSEVPRPSGPVPVFAGPQMAPQAAAVPVMNTPPVHFQGYTIQVGAYRMQASAVTIMRTLQRYGYNAYITDSFRRGERLFRVRIGRYPNKGLAYHDANRLRQTGFDTWITTFS